MSLESRALHPLFAAEARGVDLSEPIDQPLIDAIWRASAEYAVVVFRHQRLDDTRLRDFAALDGRILLYDLNLHATRPQFVYSTNGGSATW